jgi:murein DD-endopeptidase MepM/ murein hydrolase activator NlpD
VIAIDHGNGWQSLYAHLESLNVGCGSFVTQRDIIGYMGSTGNSSGPHLHYELIDADYHRVNPHHYLPY